MASQAQLAQTSLNIAVALQNAVLIGSQEAPTKGDILVLCGAVVALAEAVLNSGGGTMSQSVTTGRYSATASTTAPIFT